MNTLFRKGFTLIELLVVVVIIGILAAVALPQYQLAVDRSKLSQAFVWAKGLAQAEKLFWLDSGSYTRKLEELSIDFSNCQEEKSGTYICQNGWKIVLGGSGEYIYVLLPQGVYIESFANSNIFYCSSEERRWHKVCKHLGGTPHVSNSNVFVLPY